MYRICNSLIKEFKWKKLLCRHYYQDDFIMAQWQELGAGIEPSFVIYRIIHLCFFIGMIILLFVFSKDKNFSLSHMVYLSSWTYILLTINSLTAVACIIIEYCVWETGQCIHLSRTLLPWSFKVYWVLHTMSIDMAFFVSCTYWVMKCFQDHTDPMFHDMAHIWLAIIMLMDLFVASVPERFYHAYISIIFYLVYILFNFLYSVHKHVGPCKTKYVYPFLKWNAGACTIVLLILLGIVILIVVRFILVVMFKVRYYIYMENYYELDMSETYMSTSSFDSD